MRVERTGAGASTSGTKRSSPASGAGGGGNFASAINRAGSTATTEAARPVTNIGNVGGIDALVALQAIDGDRAGRKRARDRGHAILDTLEDLRIALLDGRLSGAQIQRMADLVASQRGLTDDPKLNDLLDEVDLRAQVELAKYQSRR